MRALIIGDPHITVKNLHIYKKVVEEIYEKIDELKPDFVVSLGDTLDTHERIHVEPLCFAIRFYKEIAKKCKLYIVLGNHDFRNNSDYLSGIHPFTGLIEATNIVIVDKVVKEGEFVFVPFVPTRRFNEAISTISLEGIKCIFAHQEFKGCKMKRITSNNGDVWENNIPIISGHIHEYQIVRNIVYVGSLMQNDYDESPDKALLFVDFNDNSMRRIFLNSIVRKMTVKLTTEQLQRFGEYLPTSPNQLLIKVIITADVGEIANISKSPAFLACEKLVDKIVFEKTNNSANIAKTMINNSNLKEDEISLELLVKNFLTDDQESYDLFLKLLDN